MSIAALQREWEKRLRDDAGFREHWGDPGRNGELNRMPTEEEIEERARRRDALWEPTLWKGLPRRARRLWGYVVLAGFSPRRAAETMGISRHRAYAWVMVIKERIG